VSKVFDRTNLKLPYKIQILRIYSIFMVRIWVR